MRDEEAEGLLAPLPEEERYSTWHLVEPDGRILDRGAAAVLLVAYVGARPIAEVAGRLVPLLTAAYELVARHRTTLGHVVPDGPAPRRFP